MVQVQPLLLRVADREQTSLIGSLAFELLLSFVYSCKCDQCILFVSTAGEALMLPSLEHWVEHWFTDSTACNGSSNFLGIFVMVQKPQSQHPQLPDVP